MTNNSVINILAMNDFFDSVIPTLLKSFKVFYPADLPEVSASIQGVITPFSAKVNAELINSLPNLKIISCFGTGVENVDKTAAINKGIYLTNTPEIVTEDTADIAMTLLLCLSRNIIFNDKYARSGKWKTAPSPLGISVSGKTLGIVGLGRIGKRIAERAVTFGLHVIYNARTKKDVPYEFYDDIIEMAKKTNFLIICCPGGPETRDIINIDVLKALGQKGYLINVSRGTTVNENDLILALENNIIAGAGLDVYVDEPNIPTRLMNMEQVVLLLLFGFLMILFLE